MENLVCQINAIGGIHAFHPIWKWPLLPTAQIERSKLAWYLGTVGRWLFLLHVFLGGVKSDSPCLIILKGGGAYGAISCTCTDSMWYCRTCPEDFRTLWIEKTALTHRKLKGCFRKTILEADADVLRCPSSLTVSLGCRDLSNLYNLMSVYFLSYGNGRFCPLHKSRNPY